MPGNTAYRNVSPKDDAGGAHKSESILRRRMVRAELLGQHTHRTECGKEVHVWKRDGKYLARGRYQGKSFGQTLGSDPVQAEGRLRRLLVEIEDGTYKPPSEARKQPLKTGVAPRQSVRQLCQAFLTEKRRLRGMKTARDYKNRLAPIIEFAEQPDVRRRWPLAADVDRRFAVEFRAFLHRRKVTRNGHPGSKERPISPGHVFNALDCARSMFAWARRPEVNQLPLTFLNPFTEEIVGFRPRKDPLRPMVFPLEGRIALVRLMDRWQLCHLAMALVLPLRPEDFSGLLISEVKFTDCTLSFGRRLSGWDFNKGQQTFNVPYPPELDSLLRICAGDRPDGPLLRQRTIFEGRRQPKITINSTEEIRDRSNGTLAVAKPGEIEAAQDGKRLFRRLLRDMGGVSPDSLAKEFRLLLTQLESPDRARFYELRGSVNTDLNTAGVSHLFQLYVTGHAVDGEILSRYVSLQLVAEMQKYFQYVQPLLVSIRERSAELGMT